MSPQFCPSVCSSFGREITLTLFTVRALFAREEGGNGQQDGTGKHVRLLFGGGPSLSELRRGAEGAEQ